MEELLHQTVQLYNQLLGVGVERRRQEAGGGAVREAREAVAAAGPQHRLYRRAGRLLLRCPQHNLLQHISQEADDLAASLTALDKRRNILLQKLRVEESSLGEEAGNVKDYWLGRAVATTAGCWEGLVVINTETPPRLQVGPQCGVLAVLAGVAALGIPGLTLDLVMQEARRAGLSKQGELFSAESAALLAGLVGRAGRVEAAVRLADTAWLLSTLSTPGVILVPYDCGPDSAVVLASGERAHWGAVTGVLVPGPGPGITRVRGRADLSPQLLQAAGPASEVRLLVRQSKAIELSVLRRDLLLASCEQLTLTASRRQDGSYILPQGGVKEGLCGKIVILD